MEVLGYLYPAWGQGICPLSAKGDTTAARDLWDCNRTTAELPSQDAQLAFRPDTEMAAPGVLV